MKEKKFTGSVSMLTWGYNEEELVQGFLEKSFALLDATVEDFEMVFIDDGSTDRMPEIVAAYAEKEPRLRVITNPTNMNIGPSAKKALAAASKEYLFWQTVDWAYDLSCLRVYLELLRYFDAVTGVRPTPERVLTHIPLIRSVYRVRGRSDSLKQAVVSLGNYYAVRFLFGIPLQDVQNVGFYRTELIHAMELKGESSFLTPEIIARAMSAGAKYIEVPIPYVARTAGESKGVTPLTLYRSIRDLLTNWAVWGWKMRPVIASKGGENTRSVSAPFFLDEEVLRLVVPLFKYYR